MGLCMRQSITMGQYLSPRQKLILAQLLKTLCQNHPLIPNAIRGMKGLLTADKILKERNSSGVLIGGLSEKICNQRRKRSELLKHKDVDVLVIDKHFTLSEEFEAGIDWWLPHEERVTISNEYIKREGNVNYWINGYDVMLKFGLFQCNGCEINKGLNILPDYNIIQMRLAEALATIDSNSVDIEGCIEEAFEKKMRKTVKTCLPKFIKNKFANQIIDGELEVVGLSLNEIRVLNK